MANASTLRQVPVPATAAKPTQTCPAQPLPNLPPIDPSLTASQSRPPIKCIHTEEDVGTWRASEAHQITVLFVSRLCEAAVGKRTRAWQMSAVRGEQATTAGQVEPSEDAIDRVGRLLYQLERWTQEVEPLSTPQRFGNLAFRTWGQRLEENITALHTELLPASLHGFIPELEAYLLGAFGSWTRLDYGSGHELSFAAWLCFLARLGFFGDEHTLQSGATPRNTMPSDSEERLAVEIFPKYLEVAWGLQDRYGLEPAGSHGVWGLDDYQFIPYAIGAAQLRMQTDYTPLAYTSPSHKPDPSPMPPHQLLSFVPRSSPIPTQNAAGMAGGASMARGLRDTSGALPGPPFANLFTTSIARIHSLKRGPFFEHSPILFDVASTVPHWIKVHTGMMKMWTAECLGKRPVVQHFPFGGAGYVWPGVMPGATAAASTSSSATVERPAKPLPMMAPTGAPWAKPTSADAAAAARTSARQSPMGMTAAPWAKSGGSTGSFGTQGLRPAPTGAPWAKTAPAGHGPAGPKTDVGPASQSTPAAASAQQQARPEQADT